LARAIYRQPRVLALDKATSYLDIDIERIIIFCISEVHIIRIHITHHHETVSVEHRVIGVPGGLVETKVFAKPIDIGIYIRLLANKDDTEQFAPPR
jgi:ATP-binding cassette subfamily B protein RaxB